jgi:hypothetical protein
LERWSVTRSARDLVEPLTFVLPPTAEREAIDRHVETLRDALINAGVSTGIERDAFFEGFRSEIKVQAINRIGLQLLFGAQFQLAYLARINATIGCLLDLYIEHCVRGRPGSARRSPRERIRTELKMYRQRLAAFSAFLEPRRTIAAGRP